jgi:hypothetical protein
MNELLPTITLDLSSDMTHLSAAPPSADPVRTRPRQGESTLAQTNDRPQQSNLPSSTAAALAGFSPAAAGSYATYRQISAHPTCALVRGIIAAPILSGDWRFTKTRPSVPTRWVEFAQEVLAPQRQTILADMLRALEFGWIGFEKIWEIRNGQRILRRLKPLLWDCTEILVDPHGNPAGLLNRPPGKPPVRLTGSKYFLYTFDAQAGNPYGRSRHENIRHPWSEAEQIRQRLAQYMKKVAGIVVQLHYPEGTSRDSAGAERPNQWLGQQVLDAVSAGRSVMFPNGFASTADLRTAYELAGKSSWQLSAFDAPGTDHAPGFRLVLEYYDALIFRGWLRPERTGLQSPHASRADAQTHTDTATLDSQIIDLDMASALTRGVVDDLLILNFGESARGAVEIEPAPIEADSVALLGTVLSTLLRSEKTDIATRIAAAALLDQLAVPRKQSSFPAPKKPSQLD